jgi:hypothetical protein
LDDTPVNKGSLYFSATGMIAAVAELQNAPVSAATLSRTMSFSAAFTELAGLHWPSSMMSSIFRPSTPPAALRRSTASLAPLT